MASAPSSLILISTRSRLAAAFQTALVPLLAKHWVLRIDAPPYSAEAMGRLQALLGVSSMNKGPRLPGLDHVIQFDTPAKADAIRAPTPMPPCMHHNSIGLADRRPMPSSTRARILEAIHLSMDRHAGGV